MKKLSSIIQEGPIQDYSKFQNIFMNEPRFKIRERGDNLEDHYNKYGHEDKMAIRDFTGDGYKNLNHQLWLDHTNPGYHKGYHHDKGPDHNDPNDEGGKVGILKKKMDEVTNLHKTPHQIDVYSAIKSHFKPQEGKIYHHPGFLSTSISKKVTTGFHHPVPAYNDDKEEYEAHTHILHIRLPKGHPGAYVDHYSMNPGEQEFILPRGMNLRHIHTHTYKKDNYDTSYNSHHTFYHVHHMEPVADKD